MRLLIISIIHLALLFALVNPGGALPLGMGAIVAITALIAALGIYGAFIEGERASDEREEAHRMLAGHMAFHVGAATLTIAIGYESLKHMLDPWLVAVLVAMIVAKAAARLYASARR